MELGKAKLLKTGLNALHQAIHPVHGIAWTDGKQVCLTSIFYVSGEVKFGDTNVIGQFEHVFGLFWGPLCCKGSPALLAVQHKKHITVWQLQLSAQEPNKLLCTQTCEMSEPFPLLSQGCVWHPKQDILAVLTKRDASVLFSVRVDNRRTKADICASGSVHCACWTKDGTRLVVAMGSGLHSFMWNDVNKSLLPCAFCPVFDVGGNVCAVQPTGESQVAVATELPLDKLCGLNASMAFEMPVRDAPSRHGHPQDACDGGGGLESSRRRFLETACTSLASSGPVDLTQLLARHRRSDPSPLLNLTRRDAAVTASGQDSSHLILVTYERKVTTSRKVTIPGILVPDIVAFDPRGTTVAVASNACSMVLVYCITASAVPNVQQISLQTNERPKGAWFLSDKLLLLMVGRQKSSGDSVFLPSSSSCSSSSSNTDKYVLRLVVRDLMQSNGPAPDPAQACVSPSSALLHRAPDSPGPQLPYERVRRHSDLMPRIERLGQGIKDLVLPGGAVVCCPGSSGSSSSSSISSRHKLVEEVVSAPPLVPSGEASPGTSRANVSATSSSSSITADNFDMEAHIVGRMHANAALAAAAASATHTHTVAHTPPAAAGLGLALTLNRDSSRAASSPAPRHEAPDKPAPPRPATPTTPAADRCGSAAGRERGLEQLVENMERLFSRFSDVQQCVVEIRDYAQNGKRAIAAASAAAAAAYPGAYEPPYVNVTCQKQLSENVFTDERRPVLLCEGKLRLSALHDLFNLTTVEMVYGPLWIVLVADANGFIPLTFKSRDEVTVRNALRKTPLLSPGSPDTPGPTSPVLAPSPTFPPPPPPVPGPSSPTPTSTSTSSPRSTPTPAPSPSPSQSSIPATTEAST
ncbi:WD repeat and coiled-coil-containing protein [Gadus chalcogrammus]|uniref:WD repeat and coiled-coil-containing protein n=1 Tax=Gadus chalcogrammus TaxID=1042646 RepID=UPI0024C4C4DD|nr:WD repeat and coiled-coil-containing protein [Gadus chalcogrammus]